MCPPTQSNTVEWAVGSSDFGTLVLANSCENGLFGFKKVHYVRSENSFFFLKLVNMGKKNQFFTLIKKI
jgi:hypothetical protein